MPRKSSYARRHNLNGLTNEEILILETGLQELQRSRVKFPKEVFEPLRKEITDVYNSINWKNRTFVFCLFFWAYYLT
jgi:hypothetical protein